MHILYIHQYFNTDRMPGSTRSLELARRLVQRGHQVSVLTADRTVDRRKKKWYVTLEDDIMVHWLPLPYSNSMSFLRRMMVFRTFARRAAKRAMQIDADIVYATSTPLTVARPAEKIRNHKNIPVVFEVRDLWPELPIAVGALKTRFERNKAEKLEQAAYANADEIVALSPGIKQGIVNKGYPEQKIRVIPNSCDIDYFQIDPARTRELRHAYRWLEDRPLVLYAGQQGMINNLHYLVDIAAQMKTLNPEVRFLVVGDGAEHQKIRKKASEQGLLDDTFFMMEEHPKYNMPLLFSLADVTCSLFLNLEEMQNNSANKFFDSLAAGKAVMINYVGWQADLLRSHEAGIVVPPEDAATAAKQLNDLLTYPDRLQRTCRNAQKLAGEFDRERHGQELIEVLERVAGEGGD